MGSGANTAWPGPSNAHVPGDAGFTEKNLPPHYQGKGLQMTAGHISWTHDFYEGKISMVSMKTSPIFTHNAEKIWAVQVTYA